MATWECCFVCRFAFCFLIFVSLLLFIVIILYSPSPTDKQLIPQLYLSIATTVPYEECLDDLPVGCLYCLIYL